MGHGAWGISPQIFTSYVYMHINLTTGHYRELHTMHFYECIQIIDERDKTQSGATAVEKCN